MKILSYITVIAAFAFGMNNSNAVAVNTNDNTIIELESGRVSATFNEATETITLRMVSGGEQERVMVVLSGRGGNVVFKEKVAVSGRGALLEIPMAGLTEGIYFLRVKGTTLNYSSRFKKK